MFDVGFSEIVVIAVVALIVIGPERLPKVARTLGHLFGRMMAMAPRLMRELGVTNGFRTLVNTGKDGMQEVQHLHVHVMGGPRPWAKG